MIVVGVDPGARETGLAVVDGTRLVTSSTVRRPTSSPLLDLELRYLADVTDAVEALLPDTSRPLLAVEGVRRPSWRVAGKVKPTDPTAIIATAVVLGAVLRAFAGRLELVVVPPGRNGARPPAGYPDRLRPTRGTGAGTDKLRHERAAYDVALAGLATRAVARARGTIYG